MKSENFTKKTANLTRKKTQKFSEKVSEKKLCEKYLTVKNFFLNIDK